MDEEKVKIVEEFQTEYVNVLVDGIVNEMNIVDYQSSPLSHLIPAETVKKEAKDYFKQTLVDVVLDKSIENGMEIINENLHNFPEGEACKKELENAAEQYRNFLNSMIDQFDPESVLKIVGNQSKKPDNGEDNFPTSFPSMAEGLGISLTSFEIFYKIGCKLYEQKQFEEANCVFQVLSLLDAYNTVVWVALGMTHQIQANYEKAISAYSTAMVLNPEDPVIYIYMAECFLELGDSSNTKANLDLAYYFNSTNKDPDVEERIESLRKLFQ